MIVKDVRVKAERDPSQKTIIARIGGEDEVIGSIRKDNFGYYIVDIKFGKLEGSGQYSFLSAAKEAVQRVKGKGV